jgi:hypothetical protein
VPLDTEIDECWRIARSEELERVDDREIPDVEDSPPAVHLEVQGVPADIDCPEKARGKDAAVEIGDL